MSRHLRRAIKAPLALSGMACSALMRPRRPSPPVFLAYHSVTGKLSYELDLPFPLFRRQMEYLASQHCVISYEEALRRIEIGHNTAPCFVLTFDDGYLDFYTHVFPLLCELRLPATLFVTTGFVDDRAPYPLMAQSHANVEPVTWPMLAEMSASPWITLGAHSHTHVTLDRVPADRIAHELTYPLHRFEDEVGIRPAHFSYPRAIWTKTAVVYVARYYRSAVAGGNVVCRTKGWELYLIPRLPIRRSDGWLFYLAKVKGWLNAEETLYSLLRQCRMGLELRAPRTQRENI